MTPPPPPTEHLEFHLASVAKMDTKVLFEYFLKSPYVFTTLTKIIRNGRNCQKLDTILLFFEKLDTFYFLYLPYLINFSKHVLPFFKILELPGSSDPGPPPGLCPWILLGA